MGAIDGRRLSGPEPSSPQQQCHSSAPQRTLLDGALE